MLRSVKSASDLPYTVGCRYKAFSGGKCCASSLGLADLGFDRTNGKAGSESSLGILGATKAPRAVRESPSTGDSANGGVHAF
jgi:hypothetical protein